MKKETPHQLILKATSDSNHNEFLRETATRENIVRKVPRNQGKEKDSSKTILYLFYISTTAGLITGDIGIVFQNSFVLNISFIIIGLSLVSAIILQYERLRYKRTNNGINHINNEDNTEPTVWHKIMSVSRKTEFMNKRDKFEEWETENSVLNNIIK